MTLPRSPVALASTLLLMGLLTLTPKLGEAGDAPCGPRLPVPGPGDAPVAIMGGRVTRVGDTSTRCGSSEPRGRSTVARHVAAEPGVGTAYVEDHDGDDTIVLETPEGAARIDRPAEVVHPAWSDAGALVWSEDMRRLVVREPGGRTTSISPPRRADAIFSPEFRSGALVAVVAERRGGVVVEDARLDNLWSHSDDGWRRLTDFTVGKGDGWSAIRTPFVAPDGSVLFVRVHGHWRTTRVPTFELWRLRGRDAAKVMELPGEMFLAGSHKGRLMWNAPTKRCDGWELLIETRGPLRSLGCGAVEVDPVDVPDPDLQAGTESAGSGAPETSPSVGVIVGDFGRRAAAEQVATRLGGRVVTNTAAPAAVRPGAFAVAIPAAPDAAGSTLRELRASFPGLARKMYVAPL